MIKNKFKLKNIKYKKHKNITKTYKKFLKFKNIFEKLFLQDLKHTHNLIFNLKT
jgi:hypothetical protein